MENIRQWLRRLRQFLPFMRWEAHYLKSFLLLVAFTGIYIFYFHKITISQYWIPSKGQQPPPLSKVSVTSAPELQSELHVVNRMKVNVTSNQSLSDLVKKFKGAPEEKKVEQHNRVHPNESWCPNMFKLTPYPKEMQELFEVPREPTCSDDFPFLFYASLNSSQLIPIKSKFTLEHFSISSCCYKVIRRKKMSRKGEGSPDDHYEFTKDCFKASLEKPTDIPANHEFIAIFCNTNKYFPVHAPENKSMKLIDMIPFVPVKPMVKKRLENISATGEDKFNVLIFGLDSMSRMNFLRTFPKSHKYLIRNMNALEMEYYNKIGDNTFPNLMPMLTGKTAEEIDAHCGENKSYDTCPFIWKRFRKRGYVTAFIEDAPKISIFNHGKLGFVERRPTDYYLRPFSLAAYEVLEKDKSWVKMEACHGHQLAFTNLLEYTKKFVLTMERMGNGPYFYFLWSTALTHENMNGGYWGDLFLLRTLTWLEKYLDNTILILLSDHGRRHGEIRRFPQGLLEDKLPMLYFIFPKKFQRNYGLAYRNIWENTKRLTTTFDMHDTLLDILHPERITNKEVKRRREVIEKKELVYGAGSSLFDSIPIERSCEEAKVPVHYCSCINFVSEEINSDLIRNGANLALNHINSIISPYPNQCSHLSIKKIIWGMKVTPASEYGQKWDAYLLKFVTNPLEGEFEALVLVTPTDSGSTELKLYGEVARTNSYSETAMCIDDPYLKCYCACN